MPLALLAAAAAFLDTRAGIVLLTLSLFVSGLPRIGDRFFPPEFVGVVTVGGYIVRQLAHGGQLLPRTPVTVPFLLVLAAFAVSSLFAANAFNSMRNWLRYLHLGLIFFAGVQSLDDRDIRRLLAILLVVGAIFAAFNFVSYAAAGGRIRVFGVAGIYVSWLFALLAINTSIGLLFAQDWRHRVGWTLLLLVYFGGLFATQYRACLIQAMFGILLSFFIVWRGRRKRVSSRLGRGIVALSVTVGLLGILVFGRTVPVFAPLADRFAQMTKGTGTIPLRLLVWKVGLELFRENPVIGVGMAQYEEGYGQDPQWRLDISALRTQKTHAHNDMIQYLASSGLVGSIALFFFYWRLISIGRDVWKRATGPEQARFVLMFWIPVCSIVFRTFWAEGLFQQTAGMINCLYFIFLAVAWKTLRAAHNLSPAVNPARG